MKRDDVALVLAIAGAIALGFAYFPPVYAWLAHVLSTVQTVLSVQIP